MVLRTGGAGATIPFGMEKPAATIRLERLRRFRVRQSAPLGIGDLVHDQLRQARRALRADARLVAAWEAAVPARLADLGAIEQLARGTITIRADHDSARFEIERWLRSGGNETLKRAAPLGIKRIRVVV